MPSYTVYCVSHVAGPARFLGWSQQVQTAAGNELQSLFDQVVNGTRDTVQVTWTAACPTDRDLVVHFLSSRTSSIIQRALSRLPAASQPAAPSNHAGLTANLPELCSEVYVNETPAPKGMMLAKLAFHELMHNKLDIPSPRLIRDLHTRGGGGLAVARMNAQSALTPTNIRLMRRGLARRITQYTGPGSGLTGVCP